MAIARHLYPVGQPPRQVAHKPVITVEDHAQWRLWCRFRRLKLQRERRARMRRIDYYVSPEAARVIDRCSHPGIGGDTSSILNRIVCEWAAGFPELNSD